MIARVVLENWRSHLKSEFFFKKGTNILVGAIGSGKSSVMDAISFALFGTFPALQSKKVSINELILSKPNAAEFAKVLVDFKIKDNEYSVERTIYKSKPTEAKLYENKRLIAAKAKDVNEKIKDILGLDFDLFSRAIYTEQNQVDFFLRLTPKQRKEKFDELLQLNTYERVRSNAVTLCNRLRKILDEKEKWLQGLKKDFNEEDLKKEKEKEKNHLQQIEKIDAELKTLKEELKKNLESFELMSKKATEFESLQKNLLQLNAKSEKLREEISKLERDVGKISQEEFENRKRELNEKIKIAEELKQKLLSEKEEFAALVQSITSIKNQISHLEIPKNISSIADLEKEMQKLNEEKVKLEAQIESLQKNISDYENKINELVALEASIKRNLDDLNKFLEPISRAEAECPLCKTTLSKEKIDALKNEIQNSINENKDRLLKLSKEISEVKNKKINSEKSLKELQQKLQRLELEKQKMQTVSKNLETKKQLEEKLKEHENKKEIAQKKILQVENELKNFQDLEKKKLQLMNAEIMLGKISENEKLNKEIKDLEEKLKSLNFSKEEFENLKEKINEIKNKINNLNTELKLQKELIEQTKKTISALEKTKNEIIDAESKISEGRKILEELQIFTNVIKYTQLQLRKYLIDNINLAMAAIWNKLYPYEDLISAKIEIVNGDYEVLVKDNYGKWFRAEGLLSGGERSAAALTLRIALSLVLTKHLSWLILDEPTHNLDSTAVKTFAEMLREHLPSLVDQIFVITHDKELEKAATASLYFLERDKNIGGVSKPILQQIEP